MPNNKLRGTKKRHTASGFTLIELLIVIGIIAVLAAFAFVALNPLARFQDARNARRWTDITAIISAIKLYQVDHGGNNMPEIAALDDDANYEIGNENHDLGCLNPEIPIESNVNLEDLQAGSYLASVPYDPSEGSAASTRYYLKKESTGFITVGACSEELGSNASIPTIEIRR
jgi:prepilin-type N-terminal cleavage/methylation domain-containing protein